MENIGSRRSNFALRLAAKWVRLNRPDVWEACWTESCKKFPKAKARKMSPIPACIANIPAYQPKGGKG